LSKPRIIFLHGNGSTSWAFAWTPWFKEELTKKGYASAFETFPDPKIARAKFWLPFLEEELGAGENDVLVGWSSGAVAAMRYAETHKVRGSVLISPSYTDLEDDLEKQSGYFDHPWNWPDIRQNQKDICLIYGDDDPYIPQAEFDFIAAQLQARVIEVPGGKHFIDFNEFPELMEYVIKTYS
jgi:predicted alpha/beta hydrolase family esterase